MTETTLKIQLKELAVVRIVCRRDDCGAIVELPIEKLTRLSKDSFQCPTCEQMLIPKGDSDPLVRLGLLIQELNRLADKHFSLEFPVRIDDSKSQSGR